LLFVFHFVPSLESLLILDGHVTAGRLLVLTTDEVRDLLVLGLLGCALVALVSLAEDVLLYPVDT
jgi:hypothetical protein